MKNNALHYVICTNVSNASQQKKCVQTVQFLHIQSQEKFISLKIFPFVVSFDVRRPKILRSSRYVLFIYLIKHKYVNSNSALKYSISYMFLSYPSRSRFNLCFRLVINIRISYPKQDSTFKQQGLRFSTLKNDELIENKHIRTYS